MYVKPYPTFPLTPHKRSWRKKYRGHQITISIADPAAALKEFHRRARAIDDDKPAPVNASIVTVEGVFAAYIEGRELDHQSGNLSASSFARDVSSLKDARKVLGGQTIVADLLPDDFTRLFRAIEPRGPAIVTNVVVSVRACFRFAAASDWIDRAPKYGPKFVKPPTRRRAAPKLTCEGVRKLIAAAGQPMRAMILLAINCAYGATDIAMLPTSAVDLDAAVIRFPRPKMAGRDPVDRVAPLWPETVTALREVMGEGPMVFTTRFGNAWVRNEVRNGKLYRRDSIGERFRRLCIALGLPGGGFYGLRHIFRTLADELEKPHATARIMGHVLPGMARVYVHAVECERLRQVTDHVRLRVLGS